MTKKTFLGISAFLNFCTLALCGIITFMNWNILHSSSDAEDIGLGVAIAFALILILFAFLTAIALVTFILKLVAVRLERNAMTVFVMIFDAIAVAFVATMFKDSFIAILAGGITENIGAIMSVAISALPLILDIISIPAESSR